MSGAHRKPGAPGKEEPTLNRLGRDEYLEGHFEPVPEHLELNPESRTASLTGYPGSEKRFQTRHVLVVMCFWCFFGMSCLRMNISIAIVAMVNWMAIHKANSSEPECSAFVVKEKSLEEGEFAWDSETQGIILSSYFYGLAITQIPGGRLAELHSAKLVLFYGNFMASVATLLSPIAARWSPYGLIALQVVKGGGHGIILPSVSVLVGKWIPPMERNVSFAYLASGLPIGAFFVIIISGVLSKSNFLGGWPSVFYVFGFGEVIWCILWAVLIYDCPHEHPWISEEELQFIGQHCGRARRTQHRPPFPMKKILTSMPVWSYIIAGFATMWTICLYMSVLPTFMATILLFPIEQNGIMSSFPNLVQAATLFASSNLATHAEERKIVGKTRIRKVCVAIGLLGFSVCILGVIFARCNRPLNVFLLVMALGMTGCSFTAVNCVAVDLSPTYAGTISGMMCSLGSLSGILIPTLVGFITEDKITIAEWHIVFYLSVSLTVVSVIVFSLFGSCEVQPFDDESSQPITC